MLILFFKHCFLNLSRNLRQTLMAFLIMGTGVTALFLVNSYRLGLYELLEDFYQTLSGDLQIGHVDSIGNGYTSAVLVMEDETCTQLRAWLAEQEEVVNVDETLRYQGILGDDKFSLIVGGSSGDPSINDRGIFWQQKILEGTKLEAKTKIPEIILGKGVAKNLKAKVGSWISLLSKTVDGALSPMAVKVKGIFTTGNISLDYGITLMNIDTVRLMLQTDSVENFSVYLNPQNKIDNKEFSERLNTLFQQRGWPLRAMTWQQLNPMYQQMVTMYELLFTTLAIIIAIFILSAVFEILSMSFLQRLRELGTLRALGNTKKQIFSLLFVEALMLSLGGIVLGIAMSFLIGWILNMVGIPSIPPGYNTSYPLYFPLRFQFLLYPIAVVLVSSLLSSIWPALVAVKLKIVEVLRHD